MYLRRNLGIPLIYHYGFRSLEESYVPQGSERHYVILPKGTIVYNAKYTTNDGVVFNGNKYSSMIQLWEELTGEFAVECCNDYCRGTNYDDIVGGHIVREHKSPCLKRGDEVLIVPLCRSCNHYNNDGEIKMARDTKAVVLRWDD